MSHSNTARRKIDIVFFDAGSGHRSAAFALVRALSAQRPDWNVRAVNLVDVILENKSFSWIVNYGINWLNGEMQRDKVFDLRGKVNLSLMFHDLLGKRGIAEIARFWADAPPDAVVSVTPMYNPALYRAVRLVNPAAQCVTVPVDFEEFKARYWFTPKVEQTYLNGSDRLHEQARAAGIPDLNNRRLAGMVADPSLYEEPPIDVRAERERLGLQPDRPTAVVHFGGQGCTVLEDIAAALAEQTPQLNVIFLCGKRADVAERIRALATPYAKAVLDYTPETPIHYQRLADVVVGKPGTLTITEALIARQPLVMLESTGMKPVQRGNEEWVLRRGIGALAKNAGAVPGAIAEVLGNPAYRTAVDKERHRGVFEAAEHIRQLVEP